MPNTHNENENSQKRRKNDFNDDNDNPFTTKRKKPKIYSERPKTD